MKSIAAALVLVLASPLALAFLREDPKPAAQAQKPAPTYDEKAVGADQIAQALARAKREDKRVLIQWGANWCGWCNLLAATMKSDDKIAHELLYEYELVKIDVGRFDKHTDLAREYGAPLGGGIPYLTFLDADGKVLENHDTGSLEDPDPKVQRHDPVRILELLVKHEAPRVEAAKLREAALARAKAEDKRLFLHFGAPWCGWCHKLDAWMTRPEIAAVLGKDFVDLSIDTERRLGGQGMLEAVRGSEAGGIPWFAFLDADGKVLATSDGPGGNTGFPAQPDELAHFRSMLEKVAKRLTKAEIEALLASLAPPKKEG